MAVYGGFAKQYASYVENNRFNESSFFYEEYVPDFTVEASYILENMLSDTRLLNESVGYNEAYSILIEAGIGGIFEAIKNALKKLADWVMGIVRKTVAFLTGKMKKVSDVKGYDEAKMKKAIEVFLNPEENKDYLNRFPIVYKTGAWANIINTDISKAESQVKDTLTLYCDLVKDATKQKEDSIKESEEYIKSMDKLVECIFTPNAVSYFKSKGGDDNLGKVALSNVRLFTNTIDKDKEKDAASLLEKCGVEYAIMNEHKSEPKKLFDLMDKFDEKELDISIKKINNLGNQAEKMSKNIIPEFDRTFKRLSAMAHPDNYGKDNNISREINNLRDVCNRFSSYITLAVNKACEIERNNVVIINNLIVNYNNL